MSRFQRIEIAIRFQVLHTILFVLAVGVSNTTSEDASKPAASSVKQILRDRCFAAIEASEVPAKRNTLKESSLELGEGRYMFEFHKPDGGSFFCQICDETNRSLDCGTLGLRLTHRPAGGESKDLPAELDRKCAYFLQKEITSPRREIDHELVQRIRITPDHTDTRWVYQMSLDGGEFRCVIRKSDGSFRVERQEGDDWRPMAAGTMF